MSFGERIKQYIDYKGLNTKLFEEQSDLTNGAIYRVVKKNTSLNGVSIVKIGEKWEDLNLHWLMTGKGEMLLDTKIAHDTTRKYKKSKNSSVETRRYEELLKRADAQIALQNDMIAALKIIIEKQIKTAKEAGIDL